MWPSWPFRWLVSSPNVSSTVPPPALLQSNPRSVAAKLADRSSCELAAATAGGSAAGGSAAGGSAAGGSAAGNSGSAAATMQRAAFTRCTGGGPAGSFPCRGGSLGAFGDDGATEGTGPFGDHGATEGTGRGKIGSVSVTVISSEAFRFMGRGAFFSSMTGWGAFFSCVCWASASAPILEFDDRSHARVFTNAGYPRWEAGPD